MATEKTNPTSDLQVESAEPGLDHFKHADLDDKALNSEAKEANDHEHSIGFIQGMKTYKRAAFWSICEWH